MYCCFFFSSRRRHTRLQGDWSSDVCSSDLQHFVIESQIVEANHQVRALHFGDEIVDLLFAVNPVVAARRAVSDPDAHSHLADLVPAADFLRRLLRFQIKIDDVLHCDARADPRGVTLSARLSETKQKCET